MQLNAPIINTQLAGFSNNGTRTQEALALQAEPKKKISGGENTQASSSSAENSSSKENVFSQALAKLKSNKELPEEINNDIATIEEIAPENLLNIVNPELIAANTQNLLANNKLALTEAGVDLERIKEIQNNLSNNLANIKVFSPTDRNNSVQSELSTHENTLTSPQPQTNNSELEEEYKKLKMVSFNEFLDKNPKFKNNNELNDIITNEQKPGGNNNLNQENINALTELMLSENSNDSALSQQLEAHIHNHLEQIKQGQELAKQQIKNKVMTDDNSLLQLDVGQIAKNKNETKENWQNVKGGLDGQITAQNNQLQNNDITNSSSEQINKVIQNEFAKHAQNEPRVKLEVNATRQDIQETQEFNQLTQQIEQDLSELESSLKISSQDEITKNEFMNIKYGSLIGENTKGEAVPIHSQTINKYQPVHEQVRLVIAKNIADKNDQITVQLEPNHLGKLEIMLNFDDNKLANMVIKAEKKEALELLQKDFKQLERNLENNGIKIADSNISFGLMSDFRQGSNEKREFMENYKNIFEPENIAEVQELILSPFRSNPNLQIDIIA